MDYASFDKNLWIKILIGMFIGIVVGTMLSPHGYALLSDDLTSEISPWIKLPGVLFLGLIQMVVIPLILCSIIIGITQSGELAFLQKMGVRIVFYFISTTVISISIGIACVYFIDPASYIAPDLIEGFRDEMKSAPVAPKTFEGLTIPDRISNLIPTNMSKAILDKNLLQIVIAAMVIGVALVSLPEDAAKPIKDLAQSGQAISMTVVGWAMIIAPVAVFGLICDMTIKLGFGALAGMGMYMLTVLLGLLCMVGVYLLIVTFIAGRNPIEFLKAVREVKLLAFSTSSSAATMPFTMACAEQKLGVPAKISRFVIPLGATINMDGTALYQAVATIFLVQVFGDISGIELTNGDIALILVTTVGASIGTPATPGVGIVVLATILTSVGLAPAAVGFILGVDRILDMFRTAVNVTGDLTASVVMDRWLREK